MVNDCLGPGITTVITIVDEIVPLFSMWGFIVVIIVLHEMAIHANEQYSLFGVIGNVKDSFINHIKISSIHMKDNVLCEGEGEGGYTLEQS